MQLARLGELRGIQKLFDSGRYNAKSTDEQGITALHVCLAWLSVEDVDSRLMLDFIVGSYKRTSRAMPFPDSIRRRRECERW